MACQAAVWKRAGLRVQTSDAARHTGITQKPIRASPAARGTAVGKSLKEETAGDQPDPQRRSQVTNQKRREKIAWLTPEMMIAWATIRLQPRGRISSDCRFS